MKDGGKLIMEPNDMSASKNEDQRLEATLYTRVANNRLARSLNFQDKQDFKDAYKGFLGGADLEYIQDKEGNRIWSWSEYRQFLDSNPETPAPNSVNPSLWRQSKLAMITGLFKVTDEIYQVRNYDISNMTFIESDSCIIVVDVQTCKETAKAAMDLFYEKRYGNSKETRKKVEWIIYTHSHADHYGGVKGVTEHKYAGKNIEIVAPEGFLEQALTENVMAGNVMSRRASYMYGSELPRDEKAQVGVGLGMATPTGSGGLIEPTMIITPGNDNFVTKNIGGLKFVFQLVPGSEAPVNLHFYIPRFKALCTAENAVHNLHNLYSLRGAKVRDAKAWSGYLSEAIERWGDKVEVLFGVHHWPVWNEQGDNKIVGYLKKQRDMYKYIHDQTLRLANHGYNMDEIAEMIVAEGLPEGLHSNWATRGYYGSLSHDVKAVYVYYLGWYDGNPATLHPLPRVEASEKYVEYMGGADSILAKAQVDYELGQYRWVAQVVNHLIYADPSNQEARELQANALEQLGYQAESGPWRNVYLSAAQSLRDSPGINSQAKAEMTGGGTITPDTIMAMPIDMLFDYMAMRLNGFDAKNASQTITLNWNFTDDENYLMTLENCVLNHVRTVLSVIPPSVSQAIDCHITLTAATFKRLIFGQITVEDAMACRLLQLTGNAEKLEELFSLIDSFNFYFNLVTPISA